MFAIAPTDYNWIQSLKSSHFNSFVNFWTPTPWNVKRMKPSERWYFLLKSPIRKIAGFGEYVEYKNLTAAEAWNKYGKRNGCKESWELKGSIESYIRKNTKLKKQHIDIAEYKIGCVILKNCQFFEDSQYIDPHEYGVVIPKQVVKFKYIKTYDPFLNEINNVDNFYILHDHREQYRGEVNLRKGQSEFKGKILKCYNNNCCISNEKCPELLEAAHLQMYLNRESNHVQNGILLRVDFHRLFDNDLLFIDENYQIHISSILQGSYYAQFHGSKIALPDKMHEYPSKEALEARRVNFRK